MDLHLLFLAVQVLVVAAIATALTAILRRPRLRVEASLHGTTRDGTLYVVLTQPKGWAARGVRVDIVWRKNRERSRVLSQQVGTTRAGDVLRLEVQDLHKLLPTDDREGWREIVVTARAWNAIRRSHRIPVALRPEEATGSENGPRASSAAPPPVRYERAKELPCAERPDGRHDYEERPYTNDGVVERWRVCRACRHVVREPLTPEQEATQRRVRAVRAERLRRQMEEEFARMDEEARARERAERARRAKQQEQARDDALPQDEYPVEVAFFVLELDPTKATWDDVVAAHRRLALAHHPDRHARATPEARAAAERKMQEINAARDRLRAQFPR